MQLRLIKRRGPAPSKPPLSVLLNYNLDDAHHQAAAGEQPLRPPHPVLSTGVVVWSCPAAVASGRGGITKR